MQRLLNKPIFYYAIILLVTTVLLVQCGLKSITLTIPKSAQANTKVSFIVHGGAEPRITNDGSYTTQLLAGIMVPKSWKVRSNAIVTFTSPKGNGTLRMIPDGEIEPVSGVNWHQAAKKMFGIGPNLVDDFEWVVYRSVQSYTFVNNEDIDFDVKFELMTGEENMLAVLGFYLGSSIESLRSEDVDYKKFAFSKPFEVTDGEGDLIDFVNPKLSVVQPVKSLDTDIISLSFDAGLMSTVLDGEESLYVAAKAFDANNQLIATVDTKTNRTKLSEQGGRKYIIDLWPRSFFNVSGNTTIARLEYYFTDQSGAKQVGYGNSPEPFKYTFICK